MRQLRQEICKRPGREGNEEEAARAAVEPCPEPMDG